MKKTKVAKIRGTRGLGCHARSDSDLRCGAVERHLGHKAKYVTS